MNYLFPSIEPPHFAEGEIHRVLLYMGKCRWEKLIERDGMRAVKRWVDVLWLAVSLGSGSIRHQHGSAAPLTAEVFRRHLLMGICGEYQGSFCKK